MNSAAVFDGIAEKGDDSDYLKLDKSFLEDKMSFVRKCFVELSGDFIFVFIGSLQATAATQGAIGAALAHGFTIFILIAAMGHIRYCGFPELFFKYLRPGGHYNPAVTLGVLISGNIGIVSAIAYMLSQLTGGFVGALFVRAAGNATYINPVAGGITVPAENIHPVEAIVLEAVFTYVLVLAVLMTAVDTHNNVLAPLAIGLSLTVDILAGGNTSGASMNPARSFGPAVAYSIFGEAGSQHWRYHYVYWVGPFLGAAIAAIVYKSLLARDGKRWFR